MKQFTLFILFTGLIVFMTNESSFAQEARKYENPQWKNVVFIDYHAGKMGRASEIVREYYMPASENAGTPGPEMALELASGEWDMMIVWNMEDGVETLNWDRSPNGVKWRAALVELCGGEDKAMEIMKEYQSCIARSSNTIGRVRD